MDDVREEYGQEILMYLEAILSHVEGKWRDLRW